MKQFVNIFIEKLFVYLFVLDSSFTGPIPCQEIGTVFHPFSLFNLSDYSRTESHLH